MFQTGTAAPNWLARTGVCKIVQHNHPDAEYSQGRNWYTHQEAQRDHRPAKSPEDGKEREPFYQAESHRKAKYGEFQENT